MAELRIDECDGEGAADHCPGLAFVRHGCAGVVLHREAVALQSEARQVRQREVGFCCQVISAA